MIYDQLRATGASEASQDISGLSMFHKKMTLMISIQDGTHSLPCASEVLKEDIHEGLCKLKIRDSFCSASDGIWPCVNKK